MILDMEAEFRPDWTLQRKKKKKKNLSVNLKTKGNH